MSPRAHPVYSAAVVIGGLVGFGVSPSPALAQDAPRTYRGAYTLAGQRGEATYGYRVASGDTIRVGEFSFRAYDAEALLTGGDRSLEVAGQFSERGTATGPWRFDFAELAAADLAEVRDLRYHLAVDGRRQRVAVGFDEGEAEGQWAIVTERIRGSRATDTLFTSRVTYAAGVPQQTFELSAPGTQLLGLVARDGLAEDTWESFGAGGAPGGGASWRFHGGLLESISRGGATATVFGEYAGDTLHRALDRDYLRLLDEWQRMRGRGGIDDGVARLLRLNAAAYRRVNATIAALGLRGDGPRIRVAAPAALLSPREEAQLEGHSAALLRFGVEAAALLDDRGLRRVASADEEAAYLRAVVMALRDDVLAPSRRLDTAYHTGILGSLPRADYLATLWPGGGADAAFAVSYEGPSGAQVRTWAAAAPERFAVDEDGLAAVAALADYAVESVADIRARLADKLDAAGAPDPDLVAGASRIERTYARLDSLIGAQPRRLVREAGLTRVRRVAEAAINDYRGLDALGRQRRVARLTTCLDDLYGLAVTLRNVPAYETRVEEAYTDEVWNNIVATVMTERVKKRITAAYRDKLVPYYLGRVRDGLTCDNAAEIGAGLTATYERVLALRDADTEALEDELRGVRDPERLLALLSVPPVN